MYSNKIRLATGWGTGGCNITKLARDHLNKTGKYEVIAGIVSPVSDGYAKKGLASAKHRCAMIKLALQSSEWIRLDSWEADQKNWNETAIVLRHHYENLLHTSKSSETDVVATKKRKIDAQKQKLRCCNNSAVNVDGRYQQTLEGDVSREPIEIKMLCGADVLESFAVPGLWKPEHMEEIVSRFGIVVCTRSGSNVNQFIYESDLLSKYKNNIEIVTEWITNDISATKIRRAIDRGESVRYLLQDPVIEYIAKNELYCHTSDSTKCDNDNTTRQSQANQGQLFTSSSSTSPDDVMTAADIRPSPLGDEIATENIIFSSRPSQLDVRPPSGNTHYGTKSRDIGGNNMEGNIRPVACDSVLGFNRGQQTTLRVHCQPLLIRYPLVHQLPSSFGKTAPPASYYRKQYDSLHNDWTADPHLQNLNDELRQARCWGFNTSQSQKYVRQRRATGSSSSPCERLGNIPDGCATKYLLANEEQSKSNVSTSPVFKPTKKIIANKMASCRKYRFMAKDSLDSYENGSIIPTPASAAIGVGDDSLPTSTGDETASHGQKQVADPSVSNTATLDSTPSPRKKLSVSCVVAELVSFVQRVRRMRATSSASMHVTTPMISGTHETSV